MRRATFPILALLVLLWLAAPHAPAYPAAPRAKPTAAVQALLDRAAGEQDGEAAKTLEEAARRAESAGDTAGALAAAARLNVLADVAYRHGDLAGATLFDQRALEIREKRAANSLEVAESLNNLGIIARDQGDLAGAKSFHQRALAIREARAPNSLDVAGSLGNLGLIARNQGDLAGAKEYHVRALAIKKKRAPNSAHVASSLNSLGSVAHDQGDLAGAKAFYEAALKIQEKRAPGSADVAASLNNLGYIAWQQGDLATAKLRIQRALQIEERLESEGKLAPGSRLVAATLDSFAAVLDESGDAREALATLRRAVRIVDASAPNSPDVAAILRRLAHLLLESGDSAEAASYLKRANSIEESVKSLPRAPGPTGPNEWVPSAPNGEGETAIVRPQVRFLRPDENSTVQGDATDLSVALLAPLPLARYTVWINGRPLGDPRGLTLPGPGDKGRILEKGRILQKGEDRDALAQEVPADVARLVRQSQYADYKQIGQTLPLYDTDGAVLRIAITAETTAGSVSDRAILRLRRPQAQEARGELRVLAIGIGAYAHVPGLQFPAADAREMAEALQAQAGDGKLYSQARVKLLTDGDATLAAIREALDGFTRDLQGGETLMLVLSGHGVKDKKGETFYFAPVGLDPADMARTGLPWKELLGKLEEARQKARAVWVLADCCRAAPGMARERQATGKDFKQGVEEGGNLVICTASEGDRPSYESEKLKHGLFIQAWLDALRGTLLPQLQDEWRDLLYPEMPPRGRVLTLSGLRTVVMLQVDKYAKQAGVRQRIEFPQLVGSFSLYQPIFVPVPASRP